MKEKILKLRAEGKSFREIEKILGCSKSTISYHCSIGQKEKTQIRTSNIRDTQHPIVRKLERFKCRPTSNILKNRCEKFQRRISSENSIDDRDGGYVKSMKDITMVFYKEDIFDKFGQSPKCYLSGRDINWFDGESYTFDHIIPVSKGGTNHIDNLGICSPDANKGKSDLSVDEYIKICKEVLENNGYRVNKL